jgi:hypothetical protein
MDLVRRRKFHDGALVGVLYVFTGSGAATASAIYAVVAYQLDLIEVLNDMPVVVSNLGRLRDIVRDSRKTRSFDRSRQDESGKRYCRLRSRYRRPWNGHGSTAATFSGLRSDGFIGGRSSVRSRVERWSSSSGDRR